MICKKITYELPFHQLSNFNPQAWKEFTAGLFSVVRTIDVKGEVQCAPDTEAQKMTIDLILEGDAAQIKLLQHKVERYFKAQSFEKKIFSAPYGHYDSLLMVANS